MLAGTVLVLVHIGRPRSLIGDLLPVVLTGVFVFLCVRIYEERDGEMITPIALVYDDEDDHHEPPPAVDSHASPVSLTLLVGILLLYILVLVRTYGMPFKLD
jgi:hypothetical protein